MDDEYEIGFIQTEMFRYIRVRGVQDLSEFIRNSDAYNRRITVIRNVTWEGE